MLALIYYLKIDIIIKVIQILSEIKDATTQIQQIPGVERTETMVEVNN